MKPGNGGDLEGMGEGNRTHIKGEWEGAAESGRLQTGGRRMMGKMEGGQSLKQSLHIFLKIPQ